MGKERVYRVVSVYPGGTTSHRFLTKRAAERNAQRRREGFGSGDDGMGGGITVPPALSVTVEYSEPVEWRSS